MAFPYATLARDFTADVLRGGGIGAALDLLGYLGTVRNILGTTSVIPSFIAKNPQKIDSGQEIMSYLWRQGIYHTELPAIQKVAMLDKAFDGAATRLSGQGVADDVIAAVYERGGNLGKTIHIVESETEGVQYLWLEEGKLGWINTKGKDIGGEGWEHIKYNHIYYGKIEEHFEYAFGSNFATEEQVKQLIHDGAKYGIQDIDNSGRLYKLYDVPGTGRKLRVGIDKSGRIDTAYPEKIGAL